MSATRRVALVTGGARRLGAAIVRDRAACGDAIVLHHGHSPAEAAALADELIARGTPVTVVQADLSDGEAPARLVAAAMEAFGRLDVVISSASRMEHQPFGTVTSDAWDAVADVNLRAPFLLMQACAAVMAEGGVIIQIADHLAAETGVPQFIPHQVTKAALPQLVRTVADAVAPRVRVNAIAPGLVLEPEGFSDATRARFLADVPLGRAGTPNDVTHAIRFLVDAPYVTGITMAIDGGRHLRR